MNCYFGGSVASFKVFVYQDYYGPVLYLDSEAKSSFPNSLVVLYDPLGLFWAASIFLVPVLAKVTIVI